jgi:hypothetical protein
VGGSLRAFVCYRRNDAFMSTQASGTADDSLPTKVAEALKKNGFGTVFVDTHPGAGMRPLDQYESRAFYEIEHCDLFVILIGLNWLDLLNERAAAKRRDASVREITVALQYDKRILPLLVDGARMPATEELPKAIQDLHYQNAASPVASAASIDELAKAVAYPGLVVEHERSVGDHWRVAYFSLAIVAYFLCAVPAHLLGISDFSYDSWFAMARVWGGLFIWPAIFIPFVLLALHRPLSTLIRFASSAPNWKSGIRFAVPLLLGTALTTAAWFVEVYDPREAPWSIIPSLPQPGCKSGPLASEIDPPEKRDIFFDLSSYDKSNHLKNSYSDREVPWWLIDKCWPNVFFYLTVPSFTGKADEIYKREREGIQASFSKMLENKTRHRFKVDNSRTAIAYRVSFAILAWIGLTGLMMSIFFIAIRLRDPNNFALREMPREDAVICLTYSIATLMTWIPFRMVTEYFKFLYTCADLDKCSIGSEQVVLYMPDILFGSVLTFGYMLLTFGMLARYRRIVLTVAGLSVAIASLLAAYAVYNYRETFARLAEYWQFYIVLAVPSVAVLVLFWFLFDPAALRNNEISEEMEDS